MWAYETGRVQPGRVQPGGVQPGGVQPGLKYDAPAALSAGSAPARVPMNRAAPAATIEAMTSSRNRREWLIPAGLIFLSLVPVVAGAVRVTELSTGGAVTPDNAQYFASPVPVVLHIISVSTYAILGALQFAPGLRRRGRRWHRIAGRILVPSGIVVALTGMWMTLFYDIPSTQIPALNAIRLAVGSAMVAFIVLGFVAIRRRDIRGHSAWMTRAYALGMGAGTQVFTLAPALILGASDAVTRTTLMTLAWAINIAVAEWVIARRRSTSRPVRRQVLTGHQAA
ncbi:DUF2306 domain-containing protein [Allorhizocola rhizosphaerae]|uniref:DUF2306 domain-containing protein n=1 Tax=Allorhizocola rhizosphaerae TaxID=1872709 RepID=UPI00319E409E